VTPKRLAKMMVLSSDHSSFCVRRLLAKEWSPFTHLNLYAGMSNEEVQHGRGGESQSLMGCKFQGTPGGLRRGMCADLPPLQQLHSFGMPSSPNTYWAVGTLQTPPTLDDLEVQSFCGGVSSAFPLELNIEARGHSEWAGT
jgi:hypothetical protein